MRRAGVLILVVVAMSSMVACPGVKRRDSGPKKVGFAEIETTLRHTIAQPNASLGASLITSAIVEPTGNMFKGPTAAASYDWKQALVLIRQGHPADGFALHSFIKRGDVEYETRAGGEVAYLPQVGSSSASAYIVRGAWLINVDMVPTKPKGTVPLADLKTFVNGLTL
jgi:hypothetical protein